MRLVSLGKLVLNLSDCRPTVKELGKPWFLGHGIHPETVSEGERHFNRRSNENFRVVAERDSRESLRDDFEDLVFVRDSVFEHKDILIVVKFFSAVDSREGRDAVAKLARAEALFELGDFRGRFDGRKAEDWQRVEI